MSTQLGTAVFKTGDTQRVKEFIKAERTKVESLLDTLWYGLNGQDNRENHLDRGI